MCEEFDLVSVTSETSHSRELRVSQCLIDHLAKVSHCKFIFFSLFILWSLEEQPTVTRGKELNSTSLR